jgi:hypothetical protein
MPKGVYAKSVEHRARLREVRLGRDVTHTPSYWGVHRRLRSRRGPAKNFDCADCGKRAATWAYKEASGFSANLEDYRPVCRSCHNRQDRPNGRERKAHG